MMKWVVATTASAACLLILVAFLAVEAESNITTHDLLPSGDVTLVQSVQVPNDDMFAFDIEAADGSTISLTPSGEQFVGDQSPEVLQAVNAAYEIAKRSPIGDGSYFGEATTANIKVTPNREIAVSVKTKGTAGWDVSGLIDQLDVSVVVSPPEDPSGYEKAVAIWKSISAVYPGQESDNQTFSRSRTVDGAEFTVKLEHRGSSVKLECLGTVNSIRMGAKVEYKVRDTISGPILMAPKTDYPGSFPSVAFIEQLPAYRVVNETLVITIHTVTSAITCK